MCTYIRMYVHEYACLYNVCVCVFTWSCIYLSTFLCVFLVLYGRMCVRTPVHVSVCMCVCVRGCTRTCVSVCAFMGASLPVRMCVCVTLQNTLHTYILIYTHAHTHTAIQFGSGRLFCLLGFRDAIAQFLHKAGETSGAQLVVVLLDLGGQTWCKTLRANAAGQQTSNPT